jgi:hypothetical protein
MSRSRFALPRCGARDVLRHHIEQTGALSRSIDRRPNEWNDQSIGLLSCCSSIGSIGGKTGLKFAAAVSGVALVFAGLPHDATIKTTCPFEHGVPKLCSL